MVLVLSNGLLIDGTGCEPIEKAVVVIDSDKINYAGRIEDASFSKDDEVIDVHGMTIMPGLIDAHLHLATPHDPYEQNVTVALLKASPSLLTMYGLKNAWINLETGVTSMRDLSGYTNLKNDEMLSLKRAIDWGLVKGPRIVVAGGLSATAGHIDLGFLQRTSISKVTRIETADNLNEIRKRVRELICEGVDQVKIWASGWAGEVEDFCFRNHTLEEMQIAVEEAHTHGKMTAIHATSSDTVYDSVKAGADTLEHCVFLDEASIELMKKRDIIIVPTLSQMSEEAFAGIAKFQPEMKFKKIKEAIHASTTNFKKLLETGIKIATGTDAYRGFKHGQLSFEIRELVNRGMSSMPAIQAATQNASEAIDLGEEVGTLEEGKLADIRIVDGNPLKDISILQKKLKIKLVIKGGQILIDRRS